MQKFAERQVRFVGVRKLGLGLRNTQRNLYGQFRLAKLISNRALAFATARTSSTSKRIILQITTKTNVESNIATGG